MKINIPSLGTDQKFFLVTIATGLSAGFIAIALHKSVHSIQHLIGISQGLNWITFAWGGALVLLSGYLTSRFMPVCMGSGIPRIKILIAVNHGLIRTKEWLMKMVATVLVLSSGVPLGHEAPTVFITGGVGSSLGQFFGFGEKKLKDLIYVGCSAGIAAAFNTPIAAVVFTLEEIVGHTSTKSLGPILISSFIASVTASSLIGQNSIFTPLHYSFSDPKDLIIYLALGLVAGVMGPLFIMSTLEVKKITLRFFRHHRLTPMLVSFLLVGLLSLAHTGVQGNGLFEINNYLQGRVPLMKELAMLLVLKFLATSLCNGSGMSGGIMLPIMLFGAVIGGIFGQATTHFLDTDAIQIGAYCLVGMGAFFASVIRTPFTSIILVFEMTRDYRFVLPLMLANLVSYFIAERIYPGSIYDRSAHLDGYELPGHDDEELLSTSAIARVYVKTGPIHQEKSTPNETVYPDQSITYALNKLKKNRHLNELKVVDRLNPKIILGTLSLKEILDYLGQHNEE